MPFLALGYQIAEPVFVVKPNSRPLKKKSGKTVSHPKRFEEEVSYVFLYVEWLLSIGKRLD